MKAIKTIFICLSIFVIGINITCNRNKLKVKNGEIICNDSLKFTHLRINPKEFKGNKILSRSKIPSHLKVSSFSKSIKYIPLETNDSVLIGRIDRVIKREDKIFILDRLTESIFCFNTNGEFLYKLSRRGQGPEEYYAAVEFKITEDENIIIYSSGQGLYYYNKNKFIKKINSSIIATDFYTNKDTTYFYIGRNQNSNFFKEFPKQFRLVNIVNNKVKERLLPYEYQELFSKISLAPSNFFMFQDTLNLVDYLNQETYSIINNEVIGKYKFEFTSNKRTLNYNNRESDNLLISKDIDDHDYTSLILFVESDNYIFINYGMDGYIIESYITKKNLEVNNVGLFYFDDFNGISLGGTLKCIEDNQLIAIAEPENLLDLIENTDNVSDDINNLKRRINISNNPILIIMDLK